MTGKLVSGLSSIGPPGVNVIKLFSIIIDDKAQYARGFALGNPFQSNNLSARPEQTQLEDLSDASFLGKLLALPADVRLDWKLITRYKHSSLFGLAICSTERKLYNIDTRSSSESDEVPESFFRFKIFSTSVLGGMLSVPRTGSSTSMGVLKSSSLSELELEVKLSTASGSSSLLFLSCGQCYKTFYSRHLRMLLIS